MVEQNQKVTVRRLPPGRQVLGAVLRHRSGHTLHVELTASDREVENKPETGDTVEVQDEANIYLGVIDGIQERMLLIGVEHCLELSALAAIEQIWRSPAGLSTV